MRKIVLLASTLLCVACNSTEAAVSNEVGPSSVYNEQQLATVLRAFERYCVTDYSRRPYGGGEPDPIRSCEIGTYIVYRLDSGPEFVGMVHSLNRRTGSLSVSWGRAGGELRTEEFYPRSSRSIPGRIMRIGVGYDSSLQPTAEFERLNEIYERQSAYTTLAR